jgi:hypothetical protein
MEMDLVSHKGGNAVEALLFVFGRIEMQHSGS